MAFWVWEDWVGWRCGLYALFLYFVYESTVHETAADTSPAPYVLGYIYIYPSITSPTA